MSSYEFPQSDDAGTEARARRDEVEALHTYTGIEAIINDSHSESGLRFVRPVTEEESTTESIPGEEYAA